VLFICTSQQVLHLERRIAFHRADPVKFIEGSGRERKWDVAVLAHCIWYSASADEVAAVLKALKGRVGVVLVAEYALHASEREAAPHVLAALARAALEAHRPVSGENIRTPLGPGGIRDLAAKEGWRVEGEGTVVPEKELADGRWETGSVLDDEYMELVGQLEDQRVRIVLGSMREAVGAARRSVGSLAGVRTMDVWAATFVLDG
jgi:hypothetical protein